MVGEFRKMVRLDAADFITDIVGESFYFDNLAKCYHDADAIDCNDGKVVKAQLVKEPHNPHDKNAVAVYTIYGKIGHLSRENAIKYQKIVRGDKILNVYCRIWTNDASKGIYGAWLNFDIDDPTTLPDPREGINKNKIKQKRRKIFGLF